MKRNLLFAFQLFCALFALSACAAGYPPAYSAESIEARVIDVETKQPLEGVIITADWELRGGGLALGGSSYAGELMAMEAVTDKNGRFYFPVWGPIRQSKGELHNRDPRLILFKPGYRYEILSNKSRFEAEAALEPVRRSDWNGKTIELKQFKGTLKEYVKRFDDWNNDLDQIVSWNPKECNWKKLPLAILATERERKKILTQIDKQGGIDPRTVGSLYQDILYNDDWYTKNGGKGCGSPKEFFQRYEP